MYNTIALHVLHYTIAFKGTIIGTRGFSKDQLKGTLALKMTRTFWSKRQQKLFSPLETPLVSSFWSQLIMRIAVFI